MPYNLKTIRSALFGLAVGDALGVPVEFKLRSELEQNPVIDMRGYGSHSQPKGTWSDDAALSFCTAECLCHGFDEIAIASAFSKWKNEGFWSARGEIFDIGNVTQIAIDYFDKYNDPVSPNVGEELSNGNGSLMRVLPLFFYVEHMPLKQRYNHTKKLSSITHAHPRSIIACFYYLEFARHLFKSRDVAQTYQYMQNSFLDMLKTSEADTSQLPYFSRLLHQDISLLSRHDIESTGYVLHTLEASIWSLLTTDNYEEAVLKAVNLGDDTDTTAAVTGGLAGLLYGFNSIPKEWIKELARLSDIELLSERLARKLYGHY